MNSYTKRTWAEISLDNIIHNYNIIRSNISNNAMMCCVIKADAYGHGAVQLAKLYEELGADWFSVSNIDEALELRNNNIKLPILILGYTPVANARILSENNIAQTCHSLDYAKSLSDIAVSQGVTVKIHLKLDTGMSRIGLMCQNIERDKKYIDIAEQLCKLPNLYPQGVFTHFAVSDEAEAGKDFTIQQFNAFIHTITELEKRGIKFDIRHCANSGAIIDYPEMHLDMVRAGIILYGLSPSEKLKSKLNLKPAMQLKSVVSQCKEIYEGTTVSYGRTFTAESQKKVVTIPIGYADGYIREIAEDGYVSIQGKKAKILGRICMDQTIVDATDIENINIGDEVIIFGDISNDNTPTADDIAKWSSTINYEVVCLVSKRVPRVYYKANKTTEVVNHLIK
ncbi:MAG: alanine racemase [Acutalibacteraceae bacterium]|nr:alanine racemase [Acutalibacteraceae bacterium]